MTDTRKALVVGLALGFLIAASLAALVLGVGFYGRPQDPGQDAASPRGQSQEVTIWARAPQGEVRAGVGVGSGIGVSPSVYANAFTKLDPIAPEDLDDPDRRTQFSEEATLAVLILWRDEPGWFLRGEGDRVGLQSQDRQSDGSWETIARVGPPGLQFDLAWNDQARVLRIEGTEVVLGDDNVVLVDQVASSETLQILGTRRVVETRYRIGDHAAVIRQSDELREFLRCELPLPDGIPMPDLPEEALEQYWAEMRRMLNRICDEASRE